ncbi:ABC transporter ATP-binding protein [Liquorilactobacillus sicerae]|uniref:ABC transporter ATP-binding protein n=1 Tax=Liquorilactobacillus sicerae TaxID=1416943 RepID=UPI00248049A8|nr:ABC transporter ATP-binding protein [Liquorilactobacillus sicerae]
MIKLAAQQLSFRYQSTKPLIFDHLDFQIEPGSFSLLTGPSGCGKSTLFKLLAGLYPQYGGQIETGQVILDGQNVTKILPNQRAQKVAMLFQNPNRQFAMRTVSEQLTFALENIQLPLTKIPQQIEKVLKIFNLQSLKHRKLQTLSGGEQQRVALATVLALDSQVILLDEPFANVDLTGRKQLLCDLKRLQLNYQKTILVADHDLTGYQGIADHLYHLDSNTQQIVSQSLTKLQSLATTFPVPLHRLNSGDLSWQQLTLTTAKRQLLNGSSFTLPRGQLGLLSGENGVGKSTLLAALSQLHPYQGQIYYQQKAAQKFNQRHWNLLVGLVFQNSSDQFIRLTAQDEIKLSQKNSLQPQYWTSARITHCLQQLNLANILDQVCYQLSGGQQKKLQLLSMLIMAQPILLLDEPFAGLDPQSLAQALQLIHETTTQLQLSLLIVSHQRAGVTEKLDYELQLAQQQLTLLQGGLIND